MRIFNRELTRDELIKRVGDMSQIAGARSYQLTSGKARGVRAVDIKTGSGFNFTVLPDRGMDISWANYREIPVGFVSKTGVVSPYFYQEEEAVGFLRNFFAGLLTTCGLTHMGAASVDRGEKLGLHGPASNTPADDTAVYQEWEGDRFVIKVRGKIRQSKVFGENIVLTREISTTLGEKKMVIRDTVENEGFDRQPFMLLYHVNFGFPIVSEDTRLITPEAEVEPRDEVATQGIDHYRSFQEPTHGYQEQCFYYDIEPDDQGMTYACLFNPTLGGQGLGAYVRFRKDQLPCMTEWKQMGEQDYVVGLEPATWYPEGRAEARRRDKLDYIEPREKKEFELEIGLVEDPGVLA